MNMGDFLLDEPLETALQTPLQTLNPPSSGAEHCAPRPVRKRTQTRVCKIQGVTLKTPVFCPGCTQRKLQMNTAPCDICGRVNEITPPVSRQKPHLVARVLSALLRPPGRFFHALTLIAAFFSLWAMTLHFVLPFLGWLALAVTFSWLATVSAWAVRVLTRLAVYIFAPATRQTPRGGARGFLVLPLCAALLLISSRFDVPLRIAFELSRAGLQQVPILYAPTTKNIISKRLRPAKRAGLYSARAVDLDIKNRKNFRIQFTENVFLGGTKAGFAFCVNGCAAAKFSPAFADWVQPPTYLPLGKNWFWWEESGSDM